MVLVQVDAMHLDGLAVDKELSSRNLNVAEARLRTDCLAVAKRQHECV